MEYKLDYLSMYIKDNFLLIKNMDMDLYSLSVKIHSFIVDIFLMDLWMVMENL